MPFKPFCQKLILVGLLIIYGWGLCFGQIPDRRRSFDEREENVYLILPLVASIPGIGVFVGVVSSFSNVGGTGIDAAATVAESLDSGDIQIQAYALREVPLLIPGLTFDYQFGDIKVGNLQRYLPGRDSPDFTIPFTGEFKFQLIRPALRFWDRRINFFYRLSFLNGFGVDDDGNDTVSASHGARGSVLLDLTDDSIDPRVGVRLKYETDLTPPTSSVLGSDSEESASASDPVTVDNYDLSFYTPVFDSLSVAWDLQYFQANGREGSDEVIAGGSIPLRGYPAGRWSDRYGFYFAIEPRFTIEINSKIDIYLARGTLDGFQLVVFYEVGQVSPDREQLFTELRDSQGFGFRTLLDAIVIRFDFATSEAGNETHLTLDQAF